MVGGNSGSRCGCLKKGGSWNADTNYVVHALNILLKCIEKILFFKIGGQFNDLIID